jgi:adenylosuccinate synthase
MKVDVVLGLQYGDEGKGKVCHSLLREGNYTHVVRFNGGGNAGHTIWHEGKKLVTHLVPSGVFFGKKSIVGPGCVVNVSKFFDELWYLKEHGIETKGLVYVAKNAHVVTQDHVFEDSRDSMRLGTTSSGNGPAYRDKYVRTGLRAEDVEELRPYLIDMYDEFYGKGSSGHVEVLAEGAQAFGLDVDWGDYPYVTSSHCGIGSVLLNGFNHRDIRNVYGVIKAYDTYVGSKKFQPDDGVFDQIQEAGQEFGSTTGRRRQCNWLDWDLVAKAARMNGVNRLIVNKVDVMRQVGVWKAKVRGELVDFEDEKNFCAFLRGESERLWINCRLSYDPKMI